MKITFRYFSILAILIMFSCSKSGTKALEKGDYLNAAYQAIYKLQKDIDNSKALEVLPQAYKMAHNELLNQTSKYKKGEIPFGYEAQLENYNALNSLFEKIEACPPCRRVVDAKSYYKERDAALEFAAEERYNYAMSFFNKNTMEAGRIAFQNFEILQKYAPQYKDITQKLPEALDMGSYRVVVEPPKVTSRLYELSNDYFVDRIQEFLNTSRSLNKYVRFYQPSEATTAKLQPDQVVTLEFLDFEVGRITSKSDSRTVTSKDSVKTGSVKIDGKNVDVKSTVKANLTTNEKLVISRGILLLEIIDFKTKKSLLSERLPGEFIWKNSWATYNGDERALSKEQINLTNLKEQLPPPPQDLFVEFCKPIYSQFTSRMKRFYEKY